MLPLVAMALLLRQKLPLLHPRQHLLPLLHPRQHQPPLLHQPPRQHQPPLLPLK